MALPLRYVRLVFSVGGPNTQNTHCNLDQSSFRSLYFSQIDEEHKEPTVYKLIVVGEEERLVGVHIIGQGSDEVMQGFAVAVKMRGEYL